uniref:Uncharacterized protein n=1 Tax=Cacopsylla melanoneura TaxID=428564 RepID=A0A8D8R560_9HEMI
MHSLLNLQVVQCTYVFILFHFFFLSLTAQKIFQINILPKFICVYDHSASFIKKMMTVIRERSIRTPHYRLPPTLDHHRNHVFSQTGQRQYLLAENHFTIFSLTRAKNKNIQEGNRTG